MIQKLYIQQLQLLIKTKWSYFNQKLFTTEEEGAPSKLGLGFVIDSVLIQREA
jgi:hypothetical protein